MWSSTCFVLVSLLIRFNSAYEKNDFENGTVTTDDVLGHSPNNTTEEFRMKNITEKIGDDIREIASSVLSYAEERLKLETEDLLAIKKSLHEGRGLKLKYKKAELQFLMKAFMAFKLFLGIVLPLGIIAAKVLSWKAVTLSLMSFMLAKILLVKNLLSNHQPLIQTVGELKDGNVAFELTIFQFCKNTFSGSSASYIPPVLIQSSPNDLLWKRQSDLNSAYSWPSSSS